MLGPIIGCGFALISMTASALDLTAGSGAASDCSGEPRTQAAAVAYLEPAPVLSISDYGGKQFAPGPGNNIGVAVGFAEVSAAVAHFCIGLVSRAEFEGIASEDLLDIVHANHFGQPFDAGRTYDAWYKLQSLIGYGLRLRRAFELGEVGKFSFTLGLGGSLLRATQGRQESLFGSVTATSSDYAVGTATWLRTDSNLNPADFNPFVGPGHPSGLGFSTDIELKAVSVDGTALDIIIMDAGGRIYWHGTRNSLLMANNATIQYDANFNREAFLSGLDSRIDEAQRIPTKYRVAFSQPIFSELSALLEDDAVNGYHFVSVGAQYGTATRNVATTFDTRVHAVGISGHWRIFSASITSNRWRPQDATALGASFGLSVHW